MIKITVESVEVEDDFPTQDLPKYEETDNKDKVVYICDGEIYVSFVHGEDMYHFSLNNKMDALPPSMVFLMWATGQLNDVMSLSQNFPYLYSSLKTISMYLRPIIVHVYNLLNNRLQRQKEIATHQIYFERWDPLIFSPKERWFSIN